VKRKEIRNKGKKVFETSKKFLETFQDYWIGVYLLRLLICLMLLIALEIKY